MASDLPLTGPAAIEDARQRLNRLIAAGYSYSKARGALIEQYENERGYGKYPPRRTLDAAERRVRQDRRNLGVAKARVTRETNRAVSQERRRAAEDHAFTGINVEVVRYERVGERSASVPDSRIEASFRDPRTNEIRHVVAFLPIVGQGGTESMLRQLAYAVFKNDRIDNTDEYNALYGSLQVAFGRGNIR